ncbi:MAG TPA: valine--tRNA ligase, partial [Trueperaceae bacterium]|nr:valine--tRNA ligase [Trueperaceae bacterium]
MSEAHDLHGYDETPTASEAVPATRYDPAAVEGRWAARWVERPFTADPTSTKPPFTIVIPPPNITGVLHLGHAFDNTIIDTLIRYKRMRGFEALFQPGTDHAGISTQVQVERALKAEGTTRHAIGREAFVDRVWQWRERYGGLIEKQLQRLGVSAAWDRSRFTMDEGLSNAVRLQFVTLYHQGKAYRRERIVNWDPISRTVLSDLEVDRQDRTGELYQLAYALETPQPGGPKAIHIATVRPETIFADVAIAVHPDDDRFTGLAGKRAKIPLTDRYVEIITDEAVEIGFGTGALKITPAHDQTDYDIGERHGLPMPKVIDEDARLYGELVPEAFRGMDRFAARAAVVAALEASGELVGSTEHTVALGLSQRTGEPVEPMLSLQWFYDTDEAARRALAGLDEGHTSFTPERYEKVSRDWLGNLRHWCISRQLWWGHRIPAWYDADGTVYVPTPDQPYLDPPDDPRYAGIAMTRDPDVFDTWFSSNLWPFSTLGWPDESDPYFKKFYPTSVLVTGYDILFFWVARMQLAGYELTDSAPFKHVMLHGLMLDAKGQKMSKSKNNGIDPLEVIEKYGADALRFALSRASTGSQDIRWDERQVEMGRNFATKLYNAARFVMMQQSQPETGIASEGRKPQRLADRWILSRLQAAVTAVSTALDALDLGAANRAAYEFVWSEFCDWYLEAAKGPLKEGDPETAATVRRVLADILKLLHPLMPFITAELHEALGEDGELALSQWPTSD